MTTFRKINRPIDLNRYFVELNKKRFESPSLGVFRIIRLLLWCVFVLPFVWLTHKFFKKYLYEVARFFFKGFAHGLGLDVVVKGKISNQKPTLFVANHASYLDIPVLGKLIKGSFVAKHEIENWPIAGKLVDLQNTIYVDRKPKNAHEHANALNERLKKGDSVIVFPEGTSNDGNRILKFKSSLFALAFQEEFDIYIQPISIAYVASGGLPIGRRWRSFFAWYGDMTMLPHLWQYLKLGRTKVVVTFHKPCKARDYTSRKALKDAVEADVKRGFQHSFD
jgi:lyso-ornithine lipid O-acyltransferase